ncbi:YraN family protein [Campylobacter concisus]|uniref:YraN family protein n=2 Tax=Campylobacter concisus TaxID=199 RepID=UPI000CD9941A|nr:YraN family protein [Campylobacter concisus]
MGLKEYLFGKSSEDRACEFLQKLGFVILERNFHSKFGEIDIIALSSDKILHFIEVKATSGEYEAEYRLNKAKYIKILKTINFYMMKNEPNRDFQVDLVVIKNENLELIYFSQKISNTQ